MPLINEIALANESDGVGLVVVLADREKQKLEEDIDENLLHGDTNLLGTRVVCRSGSARSALAPLLPLRPVRCSGDLAQASAS